jgi:hypothetical protein
MKPCILVLVLAGSALPCAAQTVDPYYAGVYTATTIGGPSGVQASLGGMAFKDDDPSILLIGGRANSNTAIVYTSTVMRDSAQHITGFRPLSSGLFCSAPFIDGGLGFAPDHVLFYSRYATNELCQVRPGSTAADRVIDLSPLGITWSVSSFAFVPVGFPSAGHLKIVSYPSGWWHDAVVTPDGAGTFDLTQVTHFTAGQFTGNVEGFVFLPLASPLFPRPSIAVAEYGNNTVATYELDSAGNPVLNTRHTLITGIVSPEGATIDPLTGDALFSSYGSTLITIIRGFTLGGSASSCYVNCDGSTVPPVLTVNDFVCFQQHFAAGDSYANCDGSTGSPTLTVNDFVCFLSTFAAGCP